MTTSITRETRSNTRTKKPETVKKTETNTVKSTVHTNQPKEETTMKKIATHAPASATRTKEVTTMKTVEPKATASATTDPTSSGDVPAQLQALEERCGFGDPLPDDIRETSGRLIRRIPSTVVDRILALAGRGGGVVAGVTLDPVAAKAALAAADDAAAVADAALMLARRAQDQSIRLRSGVIGEVAGIKTALRGYVKTKQGASLAQASEEISSLVKQHGAATKAFRTRIVNDVATKAAGKEGTTTDAVATPPVAAEAPAAPKAT